jgi:hypothetical protein
MIRIESPLIQELLAERMRKLILRVLSHRFGSVPLDIRTTLQGIHDEIRLEDLLVKGATWRRDCGTA